MELALLVRHQVATLAEGHALQIHCSFRLDGGARRESGRFRDSLGQLGAVIDIHGICRSLRLPLACKFPQYPSDALLPHSHLSINPLVSITAHKFCTPNNDVVVFKKLGDNVEALVLILAVTEVTVRTANSAQGGHRVTLGIRCAGASFTCDKGAKRPKITKLGNILHEVSCVTCDPCPKSAQRKGVCDV